MPRKKREEESPEDLLAVPRKRHQDDHDPREPMPVGATSGELVPVPKNERKTAEDLSSKYARNLIAFNGDLVPALAKTFGVTEQEASDNLVELHERARGATRVNQNMTDMMERHDLTIETRLALLRQHAFHPNPGVSLKAIDAITELDSTAKSKRIGTSWETFVSRVRQGAGPKARAAAEAKHKP